MNEYLSMRKSEKIFYSTTANLYASSSGIHPEEYMINSYRTILVFHLSDLTIAPLLLMTLQIGSTILNDLLKRIFIAGFPVFFANSFVK
jgi:hypothetical protein